MGSKKLSVCIEIKELEGINIKKSECSEYINGKVFTLNLKNAPSIYKSILSSKDAKRYNLVLPIIKSSVGDCTPIEFIAPAFNMSMYELDNVIDNSTNSYNISAVEFAGSAFHFITEISEELMHCTMVNLIKDVQEYIGSRSVSSSVKSKCQLVNPFNKNM